MSQFFLEVIDNMGALDTDLTLNEEDPIEASKFLLELISMTIERRKSAMREIQLMSWNKKWAELSVKWIVPEYVQLFASIGEKLVLKVLSPEKPIELRGAVGESAAQINGRYQRTDERGAEGQFVYKKRGMKYIMEYVDQQWVVVKQADKGKGVSASLAHLLCAPNSRPELFKGRWFSPQQEPHPSLSAIFPHGEEELSTFWEVVETMLKLPPLRKGPITNKQQLMDQLAEHREVWRKDYMAKMLSVEDVLNIVDKLFTE
jgi:hypothetical protein